MIAYVSQQGAYITREGLRLVVHAHDVDRVLFSSQLEQLVLIGNVALSSPARYLLLRDGIDTVFLRKDGRYMGRLFGEAPKNVELRKRQFLLTDDASFRLKVGRGIIHGKISNQAALLARIKRSRGTDDAGSGARDLQAYAGQVGSCPDLQSLRGLEGKAAARYFGCFPLGLTQDWGFRCRERRPPRDPVNVVLSFLYSLLMIRCVAALRCAGLDTQPGMVHEISYGKDALALDLMEEFRPLLADTLTLALFNMRVLGHDDFTVPASEHDDEGETADDGMDARIGQAADDAAPPEQGGAEGQGQESGETPPDDAARGRSDAGPGLLLGKSALRSVIHAWSKKLETEVLHPSAGRRMSYADAVGHQARMMRAVIDGSADEYVPLMAR